MLRRHPDLELLFIESGGDNLSATFSPELVDFSIYVIDVAQGEKIPRKSGQGMIRSDLLSSIRKIWRRTSERRLEVMARDAKAVRGDKPFVFTNLKTDEGLDEVIDWIRREVLMTDLVSEHA